MALLEVKNLKTYFKTDAGLVKAVDGVDFTLAKGETMGIVGESGSGKSITAMSIMRLIPNPPGEIVAGEIIFENENLLTKSNNEMRNIRGNDISMIFQDPMTSLNPTLTIGDQISEAIILHQKLHKKDARAKTIAMLKMVGIPSPESRVKEYPHQFSGGMRQRAMIAMALSCHPKLLIADEPTTALDVTIQAQILDLMRKLNQETGTAIIMITHDLGVVAELCNNVMVMYAGVPVEYTDVATIFAQPKHPYTIALLDSLPKLNLDSKQRLTPIDGAPPDLHELSTGCAFAPRCKKAMDICQLERPSLVQVSKGHNVACHLISANNKTDGGVL